MRSLVDAAIAGDVVEAGRLNESLFPLFRDLFIESNPIPIKAALAHMGLLEDELRLPLTPMTRSLRSGLIESLEGLL